MTEHSFSDETLMAFADGELSPDEAAAVEQAMETDEALALKVAGFLESRLQSQKALKALLDEPVPDALSKSVQEMVDRQDAEAGDNVVAFPAKPQGTATGTPRWALPLAASVALVAGALGGFIAGQSGGDAPGDLKMADLSQPAITQALTTVASGKETSLGRNERFRAIATYKDESGALCREFEVDHADKSTVVAVACRIQKTWQVQFTVVAAQNSKGYAPASSHEALNAYLSAVGAGEPMSEETEQSALEALRK